MPCESLAALWGAIDAGQPPTSRIVEQERRRRRRQRVVAVAIGVAVVVTGFVVVQQSGAEGPATTATDEAQRPVVHAEVVRGSSAYDYPVFDDISEAVDGTDIGVAGEVVGWSEGRSFTDGEEVDLTAVLKIRVSDPINVPTAFEGKYLYVEVGRGGYVLDDDGKEFRNPGAPPAYRTVEQLAAAVPAGARVITLGVRSPSDAAFTRGPSGMTIRNSGAGHPAGTPIASPHPQGLLFETHTGGVDSGLEHDGPVAWGWLSHAQASSDTFDVLLEQAKR